jgi:hypothetical protein
MQRILATTPRRCEGVKRFNICSVCCRNSSTFLSYVQEVCEGDPQSSPLLSEQMKHLEKTGFKYHSDLFSLKLHSGLENISKNTSSITTPSFTLILPLIY